MSINRGSIMTSMATSAKAAPDIGDRLGSAVDLTRYPIDRAGTVAYRAMVEEAWRGLDATGACVFEQFMLPSAVKQTLAQVDLDSIRAAEDAVAAAREAFGGWSAMQGMVFISLAWAIAYVGAAYFVSKWNRGVLPVLAALGIVLLIFAGLATGSWFDRNTIGYEEASLSASTLGTLTAILIPVQALLILAALQAFGQQWNIEIEHWPDDEPEYAASHA